MTENKIKTAPTQKYTNARLLAVQALYAHYLTGEKLDRITSRFLLGGLGGKVIDEVSGRETVVPIEPADAKLFTRLLQEVQEKDSDLDDVIRSNLTEKVDYARLEILVRCILKVGLAEFYVNSKLDAPIIINEYVDLTKSFFDGPEIKLVNGILDKFSRVLREL